MGRRQVIPLPTYSTLYFQLSVPYRKTRYVVRLFCSVFLKCHRLLHTFQTCHVRVVAYHTPRIAWLRCFDLSDDSAVCVWGNPVYYLHLSSTLHRTRYHFFLRYTLFLHSVRVRERNSVQLKSCGMPRGGGTYSPRIPGRGFCARRIPRDIVPPPKSRCAIEGQGVVSFKTDGTTRGAASRQVECTVQNGGTNKTGSRINGGTCVEVREFDRQGYAKRRQYSYINQIMATPRSGRQVL